jgi:hypothetical protein
LALAYLLIQFRGLSTPAGIDQAQIAREIARGSGFSTKDIRPLEAHLLQLTFGNVPAGNVPDLYHAPLNPIVNAGVLRLFSSQLDQRVDNAEPVYRGDRLIAAVSVLFFLLALLDHVVHSESGWMRLNDPDLSEITPPAFRGRVIINFKDQLGSLYLLLGGMAVTPLFLAALFHPFKREETNTFKWPIFLMLLGAFTGSVFIGTNAQVLSPNQTLILLGPAIAIYGYAIVIVLLYRLKLELSIYRYGIYAAFFLVTGLPALFGFLFGGPPIQFPPYAPGAMQMIGALTKPNEIVASDMPWAMAWYADRKSLWLPSRRKDFYEYHDYESLGAPIVGLFLTPISRDANFLSDIVFGEYKDWASLVLGLPQRLSDFPLKSTVGLMNNQCLLLMDRARWNGTAEKQ